MTRIDPVRFAVWFRHGGLYADPAISPPPQLFIISGLTTGAQINRLEPQYHASGAELPIPLTQNVSALGQKQTSQGIT